MASERESRRFIEQSAVIPYRRANGVLEVLLVTSNRRRRWIVPKGLLEPDLTARASAALEALEEAGVEGPVHERAIGHYEYEKWGGICRVAVFPQRVETVHAAWQENHRDRAWLPFAEAAGRVREAGLAAMLRDLPRYLAEEEESGRR